MKFSKFIQHLAFLSIMLLMGIQASWAADLQSAKEQGLIGEKPDGYLGLVVSSAPSDVKALVDDVNSKRREKYQEIAQKQGISLSDVETIAGKKAFEKTQSGHYIQVNGQWSKKP